MAPTEAEVLTNYLIRPASLDAILTYDAFAERFPPSQRDSPQVRALWRDLVARRELVLDEVRASIDQEVRRGQAMRWEVLRARREAEREEPDGEVEVERTVRLFFLSLYSSLLRHHCLRILPSPLWHLG